MLTHKTFVREYFLLFSEDSYCIYINWDEFAILF